MGRDKIRHFRVKRGHWVWEPTKAMRSAGFRPVHMGKGYIVEGVHYPDGNDVKRAMELNADWDRHRRGLPPPAPRSKYPPGSLGEAYDRIMALREKERTAKGVKWAKEQHSRDDWPRAWKWIGSAFGDVDPKAVQPEQLIDPDLPGLRPLVARKVSETEAHRVVKVWRALWQRAAALGYCDKDLDPSFMFANSAPAPRQAVWSEGEAVRLVKQAWRSGYHGLAALLAVAWDSQLSPVDARRLQVRQRRQDALGTWFATDRTKTGRAALATLSKRAAAVLDAYLATLGAEPLGLAPIFRQSVRSAVQQGHARQGFRRHQGKGVRAGRKAPPPGLPPFRHRRGAGGQGGAVGAVQQDGQQHRHVEPAAQDLCPGAARHGARCRRCTAARPAAPERTEIGRKLPASGPKSCPLRWGRHLTH